MNTYRIRLADGFEFTITADSFTVGSAFVDFYTGAGETARLVCSVSVRHAAVMQPLPGTVSRQHTPRS